jgi:hypothetical protein
VELAVVGVPNHVFFGREAENDASALQLQFLLDAGAPESEIDHLKQTMASDYEWLETGIIPW